MNIKKIALLSPLALLIACNNPKSEKKDMNTTAINYPETKLVKHADTINGVLVEDDYRWLENDTSKETTAWVDE